MSLGLAVLLLYVVAVMDMHYRGQVRFPWSRQVITHTNYIAPYNFLMNRCSRLPNKAILDVNDIDGLEVLRENWQIFREEALQLSEGGEIKASDKLNDLGFNSFFRTGWTRFYLKWYEDYLPSAAEKCPKTVAILKQVPAVKAAMFASLPPKGELKQHRDPYPGSLRYHLGLVTPNSDDCFILVDGNRHSWRDGEDILFDETFIHEAYNNTEQPRIILFADIHRPMRFAWVDRLNHWISDNLMKASSTENVEGEKVGLLNKVFEKAYSLRTVSRKIKRWNKPAYKTLKYGLFAGLVYLIFF